MTGIYRDNTTKLKTSSPEEPSFSNVLFDCDSGTESVAGCCDTPELRNENDSNGKLASINLLVLANYYINLLG